MRLLMALVLLVGISACSLTDESPTAEPSRRPSADATPSPPVTPVQPDASDTRACAQVRAGIDAFNRGRFEQTVAHFRVAVRLARQQFLADPTGAADDLVEAVTYYAELAPEDYPESARSSTQFARYKAITLGQCVSPSAPLQDGSVEPPGVPA